MEIYDQHYYSTYRIRITNGFHVYTSNGEHILGEYLAVGSTFVCKRVHFVHCSIRNYLRSNKIKITSMKPDSYVDESCVCVSK